MNLARRKLIEDYRAKNQMDTDGQTEPAQIEIDLKLNHDSEVWRRFLNKNKN